MENNKAPLELDCNIFRGSKMSRANKGINGVEVATLTLIFMCTFGAFQRCSYSSDKSKEKLHNKDLTIEIGVEKSLSQNKDSVYIVSVR